MGIIWHRQSFFVAGVQAEPAHSNGGKMAKGHLDALRVYPRVNAGLLKFMGTS